MIRRTLALACSCAALYGAGLGSGALASDPEAESTASPFASPVETVLSDPSPSATADESSTPDSTPESTQTPDKTPDATPDKTPDSTPESTQTPDRTPDRTPEKTPDETPSSTSTPDRTSTPDSTGTPSATPESQQGDRKSSAPRGSAPERQDRDLVDLLADACADGRITDKERRELIAEDLISSRDSVSKVCKSDTVKRKAKKKDKAAAKKRKAAERKAAKEHGGTVIPPKPRRKADGRPTIDNPTFAQADPGAAPVGVPNFIIEKFRIPPFLLPIYQAAGIQYGIRWEVLAAINEIETDYGRNLNVSYAGAQGWMQFMPATWEMYGVDANKDGYEDPNNPVDAIFAAARYLKAAGAEQDIRKAIFAYNHADWYVDSVIMRARVIGGLPANFVGSLTGLTQARFPVWAKATYAGEIDTEKAGRRVKGATGNASTTVEGSGTRRGIRIFARENAPVIAVNDGRVVRVGESERLGKFIQIQDVYGNTFTYGRLAEIPETYPYPKQKKVSRAEVRRELQLPKAERKPATAASATKAPASKATAKVKKVVKPAPARKPAALPAAAPHKERLFANPRRPNAYAAGGKRQVAERKAPRKGTTFEPIAGGPLKVTAKDFEERTLEKGARILAGTILGRIGKTTEDQAAHVLFEIRPAGRGAKRIDPKPILDGWKLLESTAIYRAKGKNALFGADAKTLSVGQILLMSKEALSRRVLANPRIDIYGCGRSDVNTGAIDRRVLATLEFLAASGLRPTVTSLKCGHGYYTASGNVSHHSSGNAVDIAAVNGISILGHQGRGSVTDITIQRMLTLQGTLKPDQIISLMTYENAPNTYAMGDHHDHIHVGFRPMFGTNSKEAKEVNAVLKPKQWIKLIDRLNTLDNPTVSAHPSEHSVKVPKRASQAHKGD